MSTVPDDPCKGEELDISSEIPHCSNEETVLKFVELKSLLGSENGRSYLLARAIRQDDLKEHGRSVSTLRLRLTSHEEVVRRGLVINKEPIWATDPVGGTAVVLSLREIKDTAGRREVCIFAEPTTAESDKLGPCSSHAGIKRSSNPPPLSSSTSAQSSRLNWAVLRGQVALCFDKIFHVCSGLAESGAFTEDASPLEP